MHKQWISIYIRDRRGKEIAVLCGEPWMVIGFASQLYADYLWHVRSYMP